MGTVRVAGLTLDSGALIAVDRGDRRVRSLLERATDRHQPVTVPTVAIAQAWRGGSRSANLARLLRHTGIDPLDPLSARAAGELLARAATSDAIDAIVVVSAARRGDAVVTTDPADLRALAAFLPGPMPIIDLALP